MKKLACAVLVLLSAACRDPLPPAEPISLTPPPITTFVGAAPATCPVAHPATVLIDPTHDGGTWWYPQSSTAGFVPTSPHQGRALADYLRSKGYVVTELGRGTTISPDSLLTYAVVLRAVYYYDATHPGYSADDIAAYRKVISCG